MSNAKRKALADTGRGPAGKTAAAGVKDRATNEVRAKAGAAAAGATRQGFVRRYAAAGATFHTGEATAHAGPAAEFEHEAVDRRVAGLARGQAHTNGMERCWSMSKRARKGVCRKLSAERPGRHVREFAGRRNVRELDTPEQTGAVVVDMVGKRLMCRQLIADNGLPSGAGS